MTGTAQAAAGMLLAGRYQLVAPLASGGMAQVWRGQDTALVRPVAVKILHPHLATDEGFVTRFRREAVASARLSHSSIVAIYDTVSEGGIEAIVMELIEGRTLRAVLDEHGVLPPADVVDIGVQISNALDEAHRAGIVHRDIKPANIMISNDRRILVTDFGIAKAQKDADLTHTGTLLGTAKYLAPEQVVGEEVDPRADLYALGIVLYEAATGKAPFLADTDAATALARLQGPPPRARMARSAVPVGLDEAIARSMAREPNDRFDRASSMRAALAAVDLNNVRSDTSDLTAPAVPTDGTATMAQPRSPAGIGAPAPSPGGPLGNDPARPSADSGGPPFSPGSGGARKGTKTRKKARKQAEKAARKQVRRQSGQRPIKTLSALLIIGGMLIAGLLVSGIAQFTPQGFDFTAAGVPIAEASAFDPQANQEENNDLAGLAVDGDLNTGWRSVDYKRPSWSGIKDGVGLILQLEEQKELDQIGILTNTSGWSVEIYVGDDFGPNDESFDADDLGPPAAVISDGSEGKSTGLGGAAGSAVLLWFTESGVTELTTDDGGTVDKIRLEVLEVRLR